MELNPDTTGGSSVNEMSAEVGVGGGVGGVWRRGMPVVSGMREARVGMVGEGSVGA